MLSQQGGLDPRAVPGFSQLGESMGFGECRCRGYSEMLGGCGHGQRSRSRTEISAGKAEKASKVERAWGEGSAHRLAGAFPPANKPICKKQPQLTPAKFLKS